MYFRINGEETYASNGGIEHRQGQPAVIFVHGAGMDHTNWVLFNRFHARNGFNTFALDLPGHGKSSGKPLHSVEAMADWLVTFIDTVAIDRPALVGHSLGSLVAIETAALLVERIKRLILLGTACPMPVGEPLLSAAKQNSHSAVDMIMLFGHAYSSQLGGNPVAGIHILNSNMRLLECALDDRLYYDLNACNEYTGGLESAARIQAATTLILGEQDRMTPPAATAALIEVLNRPKVEILTDCGHMMLSEQPEQVHRVMAAALANDRTGRELPGPGNEE